MPAAKDLPTLHEAQQVKEDGKQTHRLAPKTRDVYNRHIEQARTWLRSHYAADGTLTVANHPDNGSEIYHKPAFRNVFEVHPNECSDQALSIYLGWKGFAEEKPSGQSTIDGIRAVFKMMWDEASVMWQPYS